MTTTKSNGQIQQEVQRELAWDARVEPAEIGVEVRDGIVTLTGTVTSWAKKGAATEAAHRVHGVLDVANEITVRVSADSAPTDSEIAAAVRHALRWDVFVPHERIHSTVVDGVVTLSGEVTTYAQREDAERCIENLTGVRIVFNEVTVATTDVKAGELKKVIRDALERHAEREANRIQVDIDGGRVVLHGLVHSWREREAVVGVVTGTRGVDTVVDRLRLV